jgi:poly-gamma-glutamate capsule biosynthesis protein CapA/YwtB (metallophosphatase superfamily)
MTLTLALAGDTMLGRGVAERLSSAPPTSLFSEEVVEAARSADLFVLNLECCISERGEPWPTPGKPFFFRAPPVGVEALAHLGVDCVTLANNHALDYGYEALLDTFRYLDSAGIECVGAGADVASARAHSLLEAGDEKVAVLGVTDHPQDYAAAPDRPGVAFADLRAGVPAWLGDSIRDARGSSDVVLVTPHWGPNMRADPVEWVAAAAPDLKGAGADVVAGHSAHVFQGVDGSILFDLGDFVDDYAVDPNLRNDLGLLFFASLEGRRVERVEALPLKLEYCYTGVADGEDRRWIEDRFARACGAFGAEVHMEEGRLVVAP